MDLFVYGELRKPRVLQEQLGRVPPMVPALLPGYGRRRKPASPYYEAVAAQGALLVGLLLEGLGEEDFLRLDAYEGVARGEYRRIEAEVQVLWPPAVRRAQVYVAPERDG